MLNNAFLAGFLGGKTPAPAPAGRPLVAPDPAFLGGDPNPDTINIKDLRKKYAATGADMWAEANKTGDYSRRNIQHIVLAAKAFGLDPLTALSVGMQETKLGKADANLGHVLVDKLEALKKDPAFQKVAASNPGIDPSALAMNYMLKNALASGQKRFKDEALQLQVYNGLGKISPKTEAEYQKSIGKNPNIMYGIDLSKTGPIDMSKNPLYGKAVIDMRDNIFRQNPDLMEFVDGTLSGKIPLAKGAAAPVDKAVDGRKVEMVDGKPFVTNDDGDLVDLPTWNKIKGK